jgi:hypothetical protein
MKLEWVSGLGKHALLIDLAAKVPADNISSADVHCRGAAGRPADQAPAMQPGLSCSAACNACRPVGS